MNFSRQGCVLHINSGGKNILNNDPFVQKLFLFKWTKLLIKYNLKLLIFTTTHFHYLIFYYIKGKKNLSLSRLDGCWSKHGGSPKESSLAGGKVQRAWLNCKNLVLLLNSASSEGDCIIRILYFEIFKSVIAWMEKKMLKEDLALLF